MTSSMTIMQKIRAYHAMLAILAILAYVTGDLGIIHSWLGYGVAGIIVFRLLWALSGNPHVGLMRFYPSFKTLNLTNIVRHPSITKLFMLSIAISLIAATATGLAIDTGQHGVSGDTQQVASAYTDDDDHEHGKGSQSFSQEVIQEGHELFATLLLLSVGMHASYLLLFKRPLAKFMLFLNKPNK